MPDVLTVHHGGRAEQLIDVLIELLSDPPDDPFTTDVVSVPSRGVERWVVQQLGHRLGVGSPHRHDGVAANLELPFPRELVDRAIGVDDPADPWRVDALTWRVLCQRRAEVPATTYLQARHVADLFDRYGVYRPGLLHQWRTGHDTGPDGRQLDATHRWQPALWRRLAGEVGTDPAERLRTAVERLRAGASASPLPDRVVMLALGSLPGAQLDVLDALAVHRDVHVLVLHPSPGWWRASAADPGASRGPLPLPRTTAASSHPLLRTWGQVAHETQLVVRAGAPSARWHAVDDERLDPAPSTLLGRLQHDLRSGADPSTLSPLEWTRQDRSVQVHACHGRSRQVEVLRDAIAHLLADPAGGLELRDVVILCPDLDGYRSLLTSTLAPLPGVPDPGAPRFPLAIAHAGSTDQPVVEALHAVLQTARGRCTASAIGALASLGPVRRTFGFTDADLASLPEWIESANVRWGLDGDHLGSAGIPTEVEATTWEAALDRLLLGSAMSSRSTRIAVGDRRPCDAVQLDDALGLGRLAELVHRIRLVRVAVSEARPASAWIATLRDVATSMLTADPAQPWESRRLMRLFDTIQRDLETGSPANDPLLEPDEIVTVLQSVECSRGPSANWGGGAITACDLADLRGVPHPVICILGLDDDALRRTITHPDDLIGRDPCAGDRDPRAEQRASLLDAVLAARRHLIVTYTGHDVRTNQPMPPATPLAELLDVIDQSSIPPDGRRTSEALVAEHPRQSFSERNLLPGELGIDGPWSFDRASLRGALARRRGGTATTIRDVRLPPTVDPADPVLLADLVADLCGPARCFLERGLGVRLPRRNEQRGDLVVTAPDPLGSWSLAYELFELRCSGELSPEEAERQWVRNATVDGRLPPGRFAGPAEAQARRRVSALEEALAAEDLPLRASGEVPIDLALPDGRRLIGTVGAVHDDVVVLARPGRARAKELIDAHLRVLALRALGRDARGVVAGVKTTRGRPELELKRVDLDCGSAAAAAALVKVIGLVELCRIVALPISPGLAAAWAIGWGRASDALQNDRYDQSTMFVFGDLTADELADYTAPGTDETGRELAARLWAALQGGPA